MIAIISLLPIFGYAAVFYIYFKKTVSVSIFFSISSIITILFVFGMLDFLKQGAYLLFYGGMVFLLFLSIWFKDKLFEAVKSVPFVMFTLASIIYLYLMQDAKFFFWDEYSHWGIFIKEMYYFHHFYDTSSVAANLIYPPGISIWDYFIVLPTGFTEGKLYFAYFLILFSSTLMMYEKLSFKQVHWIVLVFAIQIVVFAGFGHWFSCIYVDHIVGAIAGLVLTYLVDHFSVKQFILFVFPLSAIVLVKEIGLYFGLASMGLMLILQVVRAKFENGKSLWLNIKEQKQVIFILFILAVSMVLILKFWGMRQESHGIQKPAHSISTIVKNIALDKQIFNESKKALYNKNFVEVMLYQQLHKEKVSLNYNEFSYGTMSKYTKSVKLSTIGSFIFFIFICMAAFFAIYRRDKKLEVTIIGSYILAIGIIYLFILYLSFPLSFGDRALKMVSYVRYINMAILPLMLIGFSLMLPMYYDKEYFKKKSKYKLKLFWASLATLIILTFITTPYLKPLYSQLENRFRGNIDKATENILKNVPQKSTLFVVFPVKNNGSLNNILKYSLIPARATISRNDFVNKKSEEMMDIFAKYDYVWFASLNKELMNKNRSFLRGKSKKEIFTLYKIEKKNGLVKIKPII
jgi:hypothetical protein